MDLLVYFSLESLTRVIRSSREDMMMRKFLVPLVLVFLVNHSAFARLSAQGAAVLLRTASGQQLLARLTGRSAGQIGQMSLVARQSMFIDALGKRKELSSGLSQMAKEVSLSSDPEATAKNLLATITIQSQEMKSHISSASKGLMGKIRGESMTARLEQFLKGRSDLVSQVGKDIVRAGQNFKRQTRVELYGRDAIKCVKSFGPALVHNFSAIVRGIADGEVLNNAKEGFHGLVRGASKTFQLNRSRAKERVCNLAGYRGDCAIFSKAVSSFCGV